jgi:2-keto-3-deoxy-L-rhamnonate aldolase RhmA
MPHSVPLMQTTRRLKERLATGETLSGMILFTGSPMMIEMMAAADVDFVIIDMEHSALDLDRAAHCIRAADAAGVTPFVRVPHVDAALIKKLLNLGAAGITLPHANRESCAALLKAMRYAPEGERGACPMVRAAGYSRGDWKSYAERANRETMAIPLLEDEGSIRDFDALAAMPGLDVYFVGPTDLSISIGVPGATFEEPRMRAALERVVAAARRHGKYVMTTIGNKLDVDYGRDIAARGVQLIVYGTDADLFVHAMQRLAGIRSRR